MFSKDQILKALSKVIHPEKKQDLVSLGMIAEIESGDQGIIITIAPEKSNDPFISSIKSTVARTLKESLGSEAVIKEIKVEPKVIVGKQIVNAQKGVIMDWVQIYYIVGLILSFIINIMLLAAGATTEITLQTRAWIMILGPCLALPIIGRVFGWW